MNWKLDTESLYVWNVEGTPFGVEKIDGNTYAPFRLWGKARAYVTREGEPLTFGSRREAMRYVEQAVKQYQESVIVGLPS